MVAHDPIPRPPSRKHSSQKVPTLSSPFSASSSPADRPPSPAAIRSRQESSGSFSAVHSGSCSPLCTIHEDRILTTAKSWLLGRPNHRHSRTGYSGQSQGTSIGSSPTPLDLSRAPHDSDLMAQSPDNTEAWMPPSEGVGELSVDSGVHVSPEPEAEGAMQLDAPEGSLPLPSNPPGHRFSMKDIAEWAGNMRRATAKLGPEQAQAPAPAVEEAPEVEETGSESAITVARDEEADDIQTNNTSSEDYWNGSTYVDGREMHYCGPDHPCQMTPQCIPSVAEVREYGLFGRPPERKGSAFGNPVRALFRGKKRAREEVRRPSSVEVVRYGDEVTRVVVQDVEPTPPETKKDRKKLKNGGEDGANGEGNGKQRWRKWWTSWTDHGGRKGWLRRPAERGSEEAANPATSGAAESSNAVNNVEMPGGNARVPENNLMLMTAAATC